jgi:hypothetical protein
MKCNKIQRWISDRIDGIGSRKEKAMIGKHIEVCSACRAFQEQMREIEEQAKFLALPEFSPAPSGEFVSRLRSTISEIEEKRSSGILHVFRKKWIFIPASAFILTLFILIFVFYEKGDIQEEDVYFLSFGNAMEEIYEDIGDDVVLHQAFNTMVSASINEMLGGLDWDEGLDWETDLFLWEELSEEELGILEQQIKNENNS